LRPYKRTSFHHQPEAQHLKSSAIHKLPADYPIFSGGSHTSAAGPVHNPRKLGYSAGGSSSGSAALLAAGEVDMAIGGDQGGSIRIPAAYCGVYGMKPTHGLVPYTGIMPVEITLDHTGPMTRNVGDNALLLEVLAGEDGLDPRQYNVKTRAYTDALNGGVKGLRIGVVKEGFGLPNSEPDVDAKVKQTAGQCLGTHPPYSVDILLINLAKCFLFTVVLLIR
jgi:amidase